MNWPGRWSWLGTERKVSHMPPTTLKDNLNLPLLPLQSSAAHGLLHLLAEHQAEEGQHVETRAAIQLLRNLAKSMGRQADTFERRAVGLTGTNQPLEGDHTTTGPHAQAVTVAVLMADHQRGVELLMRRLADDMEG